MALSLFTMCLTAFLTRSKLQREKYMAMPSAGGFNAERHRVQTPVLLL